MSSLSISRAWDETKGRIASDGKLMMVVAAALIVLPVLVTGVVDPASAERESSLVGGLLFLVASLLAIVGQLAIIRLALASAVSVGEAIGHGGRRMPIYLVAGILIITGLLIALVPVALILVAAGVPLEEQAVVNSPIAVVLLVLYALLLLFVAIRMLMSSPVASEEEVGPIGILRRSWELTAGHWWRLFGFLVLFLIGMGILMAAINYVVVLVAALLFGPVEPMSASALVVALVEAVVNAAASVLLAVMLARIYVQLSGRDSLDVTVPKTGT